MPDSPLLCWPNSGCAECRKNRFATKRREWAYQLLVDRKFTTTADLAEWAKQVETALFYACDECTRA